MLSDGKIEMNAQGTGKILGIDAIMISTSAGTIANGIFMGESNSVLTTMEGETIMAKGIAVGYPYGNGGATKPAYIHSTQSQKFSRLNKVVGMHEYATNMTDNLTGKTWELK